MSHRDVPIPERIKASCKMDPRGFPITFVTFIRPDTGEPDFRVVDYAKAHRCMVHRLCGICGQPLGRSFALIGGPESVKNRVFSDPPMHFGCARYAMKVCPYLASPRGRHRPIEPDARTGEVIAFENPLAGVERPAKIAIYQTTGYEVILVAAKPGDPPIPALRAELPVDVEWFD